MFDPFNNSQGVRQIDMAVRAGTWWIGAVGSDTTVDLHSLPSQTGRGAEERKGRRLSFATKTALSLDATTTMQAIHDEAM
jgi:hypothetical protein